ncbi:SAM-dependent methyltransferase [Aurantimonas sp. MSK8Z-1]|uniref:class I SAM-dependent methyltransferase n=1 Tax=Mangrovibrevibacter kandeliae TaxID=2968473 RepID=UPI002119A8F0|nr:SAM-dependent methyltransferase [Aurantimonas sp. MSK8Z-1]MCW4113809.1 SAM-dependent methyltransferase [Aurantimonas sp. MSK8Z-1]
MTPLGRRIAEAIRRDGPMRLDRFWNIALFDREHGYYSRQMPFGRSGDFVTAPDISQIFGELVAVWLIAAWRGLGTPASVTLAEIGPGRGTLMADILRTLRRVAPDLLRAARIRLVEVSDRLAALQAETLAPFDLPVRRLRRLEDVEPGPLLLVGNELFDAVAIRQFVFDGTAWRERCIDASAGGRLSFVLCPQALQPPGDLMARLPPPAAGAVLEVSPEREALAGHLAARLARDGGAALFFDYGHALTGFGDTLQAIGGHACADPLTRPGEIDITSHVDFARLAARFEAARLTVSAVAEQGETLLALGLLERAGALGADGSAAARAVITAAVERLAGTGPGQMGRLFKVLAVASAPLALPPFAPSQAD